MLRSGRGEKAALLGSARRTLCSRRPPWSPALLSQALLVLQGEPPSQAFALHTYTNLSSFSSAFPVKGRGHHGECSAHGFT